MKTRKIAILLSSCLFFTSCGTSQTSESINLVCAFIEGYLDNKALALTSVAQGGSAAENIEATIGGISSQVAEGTDARPIFDDFYSAMLDWGKQVDLGFATSDSNLITAAAALLEKKIDPIASQCQDLGWKFEKNWR